MGEDCQSLWSLVGFSIVSLDVVQDPGLREVTLWVAVEDSHCSLHEHITLTPSL